MNNIAKQKEGYPIYQDFGIVIDESDGSYIISCDHFQYTAHQAAGCLLKPERGDKVLFVGRENSECYILSVLERNSEIKQQIVFKGSTEILCQEGKLRIAGQKGISLASPKHLELISSRINAIAKEGDCSISNLTFLGNRLLVKISNIKLLAGIVETMCERFQQKTKTSYRIVEDLDHLKAGKIDFNAEKVMSLRGKYSILTAQEDIKIDGERIHMG